jgi:predicted nucleotidyltransferase
MADDIVTNFLDLKDSLEALFNRPVDLMAEQPIRNPYLRESVERTKRLIYERAN